ncbi:MAG: hypothetical protein O3A00_25150, partial [Planctomycetota bacterium]|nr:hypothetical protein [Planctomycetota bacterium]
SVRAKYLQMVVIEIAFETILCGCGREKDKQGGRGTILADNSTAAATSGSKRYFELDDGKFSQVLGDSN